MSPLQAVGKKGLLVVLFIASFAIPVYFGSSFFSSHQQDVLQQEEDAIFPHRLVFQGHNAFLFIRQNPALNPKDGQDYLVTAWFKLSELPVEEKETVLFSKIEHDERFKPGFSLSLVRRGPVVRPLVYWKDREGKGGVYEFSDLRVLPNVWMNFVLTLERGELLGLYVIEQEEGKKPKRLLLGGFRFAVPVYAAGNCGFVFGEKGGDFRGEMGPIGIFAGEKILVDFTRIIRAMSKDPADLVDLFGKDATIFFSNDGISDQGSQKHQIVHSQMLGKVNNTGRGESAAEAEE